MNIGENKLVGKISAALGRGRDASPQVRIGMGDDAALFSPRSGHEVVLTCDWFLEGTHFLRDKHPPDSVGWKSLARAVSDVAAMGGVPRCFLLSLALPTSHAGRWLGQFLAGLLRASRKFRCVLAGGDTTRRAKILINVSVVGEVRTGRAVLRSGARPGDLIYVSGRLGEAELGLQSLKRAKRTTSAGNRSVKKHLYPEPRLTLGQWLAEKRLATAIMDLSDGLSTDLPRLCAASGVGARLNSASIPLVRVPANLQQRKEFDPLKLALHGGDDYELLFTVHPKQARLLPRSFRGVSLNSIGIVTSGENVLLADENGGDSRLFPGGWDPFESRRSP